MKIFTRRLRHTTMWMFLLIMPVGVRIDGNTGDELTIEGHVGAGQLASVIRDCSGDAISSESNSFSDYAGAVQYSHRFGEGNFVVLGLRSGQFRMDYQAATTAPVLSDPYRYEYSYWNPYVAIESPYMGFGIGYLSEDPLMGFGKWDFGSIEDLYFGIGDFGPPISAHLRFGNYAKAHFLATYNENLPMVSGGGNITLGVGYHSGNNVSLFTGLTAAPYDRPGLVQKLSWGLSERFDLDLNGRAGAAGGTFEGSFSLGLRYHLPVGEPSGHNPFLEKNRKKDQEEEKEGPSKNTTPR